MLNAEAEEDHAEVQLSVECWTQEKEPTRDLELLCLIRGAEKNECQR